MCVVKMKESGERTLEGQGDTPYRMLSNSDNKF